jgi:hypothetical protein
MAQAAAGNNRVPAFKFGKVGDGFKNAVVTAAIVKDIPSRDPGKDPITTLILELELAEPRTQTVKVANSEGYLEEQEVTGVHFVHFIKASSQPLDALSHAIRDGGGTADSPEPGDVLSCILVGEKATDKGNAQKIYAYEFSPGTGGELTRGELSDQASRNAAQPNAEYAEGNKFLGKLEKPQRKETGKPTPVELDPNEDEQF